MLEPCAGTDPHARFLGGGSAATRSRYPTDTATGQVRRGQIAPADREHLRAWLARFAGRDDAAFAVEGCTGWRYVAEELAAAGVTAHVAEPADTAFARGRKRHAKTDKTDSRHLRVLLAEGRLPECWIPPGAASWSAGRCWRPTTTCDREHLRAWLARFAGCEDVAFAVEGCTGWRYVAEELAAAGVAAHLAEPADTAFARGRKRHAKTDKTDCRHLRQLLAEGRLPECWIPPSRIVECRALLELYHDLRAEHTAWAQRIHAVLFHQGAPALARVSGDHGLLTAGCGRG